MCFHIYIYIYIFFLILIRIVKKIQIILLEQNYQMPPKFFWVHVNYDLCYTLHLNIKFDVNLDRNLKFKVQIVIRASTAVELNF